MAKPFLFRWRDAFMAADGPAPMTRLVLHTLASHMTVAGTDSHPSIPTIARESGMSRRSVLKHLADARAEGWITANRERGGRGGFYHSYLPSIPQRGADGAPGAGRAPGLGGVVQDTTDVVQRAHERGAGHDTNVVQQAHPSTSGSTSVKTPQETPQRVSLSREGGTSTPNSAFEGEDRDARLFRETEERRRLAKQGARP